MALCRPGLAAVAAALALVAGCRTPAPPARDVDRRSGEALRVVVAPMNLPIELALDLADAVDPVTDELVRYLQESDARVSTIFGPDAWSLWRESTDALQKGRDHPPDLAAIASVFARALARESRFDLLVLPSLVYRDAEVMGRHAQWDGVRRRIRFRLPPGAPFGRAAPPPDPVASAARTAADPVVPEYRGRITGLSLHTLVFAPDGRGIFQGFGGLDLVHDTVQARDGSGDTSVLRLRTRLLENPENVREGVAQALSPYHRPQ